MLVHLQHHQGNHQNHQHLQIDNHNQLLLTYSDYHNNFREVEVSDNFAIVPYRRHENDNENLWLIVYQGNININHTDTDNSTPNTREVLPLRFVFVTSTRNGSVTLHPHFVFRYPEQQGQHSNRRHQNQNTGNNNSNNNKRNTHLNSQRGKERNSDCDLDCSRHSSKKQRVGTRIRHNYSTANMEQSPSRNGYDCMVYQYDPVEKVFFNHGLLHCIFSYLSHPDLISTSTVNKFCMKTSRSDTLWKEHCILLWRDKVGMPLLRKGRCVAPFWRTFVTRDVVEHMSIKDIKGFFAERPLGRREVRDLLFVNRVEKRDMQNVIIQLMPEPGELGDIFTDMEDEERLLFDGTDYDDRRRKIHRGFSHLWFGSFVCSVVDSRRCTMILDELLSRKGFLMNWKVIHEDHDIVGANPEISLHYHCTCYFEEEDQGSKFRMEDDEVNDIHHPDGLTWRWVVRGKAVQVGLYPPLVIHRLDNWGWKLENQHVVLLSQ